MVPALLAVTRAVRNGIIHAMEPAGFDPGLGLGGSGETPPDRARCVGFLAKPAARLVAAVVGAVAGAAAA